MSSVEAIPAHEWRQWVEENDGVVLDVREPDEWDLGVLPDAVQMSMGDIVRRIDELDKVVPLLVVCRSGARSGQVAGYLAATGYRAANMVGGMKALGMQD